MRMHPVPGAPARPHAPRRAVWPTRPPARGTAAGLVFLLLGAGAGLAGLGFAAPEDPMPVEDHRFFTGDAWAAWRFTTAGGDILVEGRGVIQDAPLASIGVWLLDGDLGLIDAGVLSFLYTVDETHLQVAEPVGTLVHRSTGGATGTTRMTTTYFDMPAGEYVAVALMGAARGTTTDGRFRLGLEHGGVVMDARSGAEAFLAREPDFAGVVNTHVDEPGMGQVKVIVDGTYPFPVDGRLFGLMALATTSNLCLAGYDGPDGGGPADLIHGAPAGDYTFEVPVCVDGAWGGQPRSRLWAVGADVDLP